MTPIQKLQRWQRSLAHDRRGFTLVEVLIVIAIILLLAVLLIPSFVGFLEGRKLRAGGAKVESAILRAKSAATSTRRMHYVVFDRFNHRLTIVDSGLDSRADLDSVDETTGELFFRTGSDDKIIPSDPEQSSLPKGVFFARMSESTEDSELLFSEQVRCYPDGAIIATGRPDVPTVDYLNGAASPPRKGVGADIVLTSGDAAGDPIFPPPEGGDDIDRGVFIDINPTTGRIRYEVDTWGRDYH